VIANIAYKAGLINIEIFSILVLIGVLTTITTPMMLKKSFGLSHVPSPTTPTHLEFESFTHKKTPNK